MKSRIKPLAGAIALIAIASIHGPSGARAAQTVSYSTSGSFSVNSQSGATITLSNGNAAVEISFAGTSQSNLSVPNATSPFGTFTAKNVDPGNSNINLSGSFTLTLNQSDPTSQIGNFTSVVSGDIQFDQSNKFVTITFNSPPNPITIGSIKYQLPNSITLASPANTMDATTSTNLTANVTVLTQTAPEPSTLVMAVSAIGGLVLLRLRRLYRTPPGS